MTTIPPAPVKERGIPSRHLRFDGRSSGCRGIQPSCKEGDGTSLMEDCRDATLEEAAKVCEDAIPTGVLGKVASQLCKGTGDALAHRIRALKNAAPQGHAVTEPCSTSSSVPPARAASEAGKDEVHPDTERLEWLFSNRDTPTIVGKIENAFMHDPNRGTWRDAIDAAKRSATDSGVKG